MGARLAASIALGLVAAGVLCACAATIPEPTSLDLVAAQTRFPSVSLADLSRGRMAYLEHCTSCHAPHAPREFAADRWPGLVAEMRTQAHLEGDEEQQIVTYLMAEALAQSPKETVKTSARETAQESTKQSLLVGPKESKEGTP